MQCDQFYQRVQEILDHRANPNEDEQLVRHAAQCAQCEAELRAYAQLMLLTRDTTIATEKPANGAARGLIKAALAAAMLLAFVYGPRPQPQAGSPSVAQQPQVTAQASPPLTVAGQRMENTSPAGNEAYLMHQPIVGLHLLSRGDWSNTVSSVAMPFGAELPEVGTEWVAVVTDGMSPLQSSLTSTLRLIRRSVAPHVGSIANRT